MAPRQLATASADAQDFQPTPQQQEFRDHAALCVRNAKALNATVRGQADEKRAPADFEPSGLLVGEWLETAAQYMDLPAPTMKLWRQWEADAEFREWFLEAMPTMQAMTLTDMLAVNALYHRAMAHALAAGDMRATSVYGAQLRAKDEADPRAMMDLRSHIDEAKRTTKWRPPTADEAERGRDPDPKPGAPQGKGRGR